MGMEWINIKKLCQLFQVNFDNYSEYGHKGSDKVSDYDTLNNSLNDSADINIDSLNETLSIAYTANEDKLDKPIGTTYMNKSNSFITKDLSSSNNLKNECFVIEKLETNYSNVYKNLSYFFKFNLIDISKDCDTLNDSLNDSADINIDSLNETLSIAYNPNNNDKLSINNRGTTPNKINELNQIWSIEINSSIINKQIISDSSIHIPSERNVSTDHIYIHIGNSRLCVYKYRSYLYTYRKFEIMCIYMYVYIYVCIYICIYMNMYIYEYVYIYIYMYTYINIYIQILISYLYINQYYLLYMDI
jgi:hypothetical protein